MANETQFSAKTVNMPIGFVDARGLAEALFAEDCRPCLRTIRNLTAKRAIPFMRFGGRIIFDVELVRATLTQQPTAKPR